MDLRRALAAASVVLGLLASATPSSAANTHTMDGKKRTKASYRATLSETHVPSSPPQLLSTAPEPKDCRPTSCDVRDLRLVLPKGTSRGDLIATVVVPRELVVSVVLYDSDGDIVMEDDTFSMVACCDFQSDYTFTLKVELLYAGRYTLAVIDRAGSGEFKGTVNWIARPPDRKRVNTAS